MSNLDSVMDKIKLIFDISEEKITSLTSMLNDIEINRINERFDEASINCEFLTNDLISKTNLLNAMMEIILENPSMNDVSVFERKKVLQSLYETTSVLYEQLLKDNNVKPLDKILNVAMYSMLSYLADKQTISNILIENYHNEIHELQNVLDGFSTLEQLEFYTFYLIILMVSNIKNYDGLINLNFNISITQNILDKAQDEELAKEEIEIRNGLKISAFGNIIHLVIILKEYLFTGKVQSEENQDIFSLIDIYSYNAFYLLDNEEIELKLVGHLVKYVFEQVAENSIWNIAEKLNTPFK